MVDDLENNIVIVSVNGNSLVNKPKLRWKKVEGKAKGFA